MRQHFRMDCGQGREVTRCQRDGAPRRVGQLPGDPPGPLIRGPQPTASPEFDGGSFRIMTLGMAAGAGASGLASGPPPDFVTIATCLSVGGHPLPSAAEPDCNGDWLELHDPGVVCSALRLACRA